jgi:Uma2 family endonuclease
MSAISAATIEPRNPAEVTLEAWADMDEDEPGEFVDGQIVEEEVPSVLHEAVVSWSIGTLRAWAISRGGRVYGSELKLGLSPKRGRKADVSMYLPGAPLPAMKASLTRRPPSLVIEVISPRPRDARRDRVEKVREYARFGVRFFWLLDPQLRTLEILELGSDERYTIALTASDGAHPVPGCDGLTVDLDALWAELDGALSDEEGEGEVTE